MSIANIIGLLRKTLIADSTVNGLVGLKVFPTHIAVRFMENKLNDEDFPCITIHDESSNVPQTHKRDGWYRFLIQCWSNDSQSECHDIHDAVRSALFGQVLKDTNYNIKVFEDMAQGILSEKTEAGIRHWHSTYFDIWATYQG